MKRATVFGLGVLLLAAACSSNALAADRPADRVVAIYFHRTERCPTCQKMGSYSEEAVKQGFAEQVKKGTVEFFFVDYEAKKNAKLTNGYKVTNPTLVIAKIVDNRVKEKKELEDIWNKVDDKPEFLKYVQENVAAYRK